MAWAALLCTLEPNAAKASATCWISLLLASCAAGRAGAVGALFLDGALLEGAVFVRSTMIPRLVGAGAGAGLAGVVLVGTDLVSGCLGVVGATVLGGVTGVGCGCGLGGGA